MAFRTDTLYPVMDLASMIENGVDPVARTLYLIGDIDEESAKKFMVALRFLDAKSGQITVILNSNGGCESDGYAIYDAIRMTKNPVRIEVFGVCHSIAAVILQAGSERVLAPEASFMIHHGNIGMEPTVDQDKVVSTARQIDADNRRYHKILAKASGQSIRTITDYCLTESHFDAKTTVNLGFADSIMKVKR